LPLNVAITPLRPTVTGTVDTSGAPRRAHPRRRHRRHRRYTRAAHCADPVCDLGDEHRRQCHVSAWHLRNWLARRSTRRMARRPSTRSTSFTPCRSAAPTGSSTSTER
jgi:hypothetical protein